MTLVHTGALVALLIIAFLLRNNPYALSVVTAAVGVSLAALYNSIAVLDRTTAMAVLKASTLHRRSVVRVSIAYLVSVQVDDTYLLVRGGRIRTQFQPVGGVFKTDLTPHELYSRFRAEPDNRFRQDEVSESDLRIRLPGAELQALLTWFRRGLDREVLPLREFYEEVITTRLLKGSDFQYIDCRRVGLRSFGLTFDRHAACQQLILAEIWALRATPRQLQALRELRDTASSSKRIYFASRKEMLHGGHAAVESTDFDIAPTAKWLLEEKS